MPSSAVSSSSVALALVVAHGDRHDLALEPALGRGPGGPLLALRAAYASRSSREMPHWSAIISAPMPWLTRPPRLA